jgi:hypothetical protein
LPGSWRSARVQNIFPPTEAVSYPSKCPCSIKRLFSAEIQLADSIDKSPFRKIPLAKTPIFCELCGLN